MDKDEVLNKLKELLSKGETIVAKAFQRQTSSITSDYFCDRAMFLSWLSAVLTVLKNFELQQTEYADRLEKYKEITSARRYLVKEAVQQLDGLIEAIEQDDVVVGKSGTCKSSLKDLENIFNKFARVARQLRTRHDGRETLSIRDEYDVQDLLHSLLLLHFDDVRAEEWTPSYAGGCERMDFLLKDLQTVIEVKKTRDTMTIKKLGEELIVDIEKYKTHPDCKQLYCFVYDPEFNLGNPASIQKDLEEAHKGFVKVFVRPEM